MKRLSLLAFVALVACETPEPPRPAGPITITSALTANTVLKATSGTQIANSGITDDGSSITLSSTEQVIAAHLASRLKV